MKYIDMHCDTLSYAYFKEKQDIVSFPEAMADLERMRKGGVMAQFFAVFMPPQEEIDKLGDAWNSDDDYIDSLCSILKRTAQKHSQVLSMAYHGDDVRENEKGGRMSALLTLEDGRSVEGSMEKLEQYYKKGFRLISLTWNGENCFGYPNSTERSIMESGLKDFGKAAVERMNELGMLVDVSHLSDGGFQDVLQICKKPFVASHSNCRALSPHPRNLTDEMIRALADHGGVAGLNFSPSFLNADVNSKDSRVVLMTQHIRHLVKKGGIDCAAIGTDFDGIEGKFEIGEPEQMEILFDALQKCGFHEAEVEKIAYGNVLRVIDEVL